VVNFAAKRRPAINCQTDALKQVQKRFLQKTHDFRSKSGEAREHITAVLLLRESTKMLRYK
jgi:hypothetical protein